MPQPAKSHETIAQSARRIHVAFIAECAGVEVEQIEAMLVRDGRDADWIELEYYSLMAL